MRSFHIDAKMVIRKSHYIVYVKEGSMIVDMLNIMEAHVALMNFENVRILKEMRNTINRKVNCEAANISKTVKAIEHIGIDNATDRLTPLITTTRITISWQIDNIPFIIDDKMVDKRRLTGR